MTEAELIQYATHLSRVGILRTGANRQSCVASGKVLTEVLRSFHIPARPMCASILVATDGWLRRMEAGDRPTDETWDAWWDEDRAYSLGVLYDPTPDAGAWNAHLIVLVGDRWLLDPSIDQLSRPAKDLPLEPVALNFADAQTNPHEFKRGRTQAIAYWSDESQEQGFMTIWSCFPADRSYRDLPDWVEFEFRYGEMTRSIVNVLRDMQEEGLTGDDLPPLPPLPNAPDNPAMIARHRPQRESRRLAFDVEALRRHG